MLARTLRQILFHRPLRIYPHLHPRSRPQIRLLHTTLPANDTTPIALNNILAGGAAPAVQVKTITPQGIELADGLIIPSACLFINGKTFLWEVPEWEGWREEHF